MTSPPIVRPRVAPAADWPRVVRSRWAPTFVGFRGDGIPGHLAWALYIDGELVQGFEWIHTSGPLSDDGGMEWSPRPIDPRDWPAGEHDVAVTLFAQGPDPNGDRRVQAFARATVRFEHDAPVTPEPPVPVHARLGLPVPNVGPFFVAPFYQSVREAIADPARRDAYHAAGLWTYTESTHVPLGPVTHEYAMWELRRNTAGFREFFAAYPQARVVLIWDNLPLFEYAQTLANPQAPRIIADTLAYWQEITRGRVFWLRVADEATEKFGPLPHPIVTRVTDWLREPCARHHIALAWSGGAHAGPAVAAQYANLTGAFDLYAMAGVDDGLGRADGYTLPRARVSHERTWQGMLQLTRPDARLVGSVGVASTQYTKGDSDPAAGFYRPGIDIAHTPPGRSVIVSLVAGLGILQGACGVDAYFDDTAETIRQRMRETFPRSVLGEPLQTGAAWNGKGVALEMWRALGAVQRFTDRIGMRLFDYMYPVPSLAPGVRGSLRGDDVLLLANTREVPATLPSLPIPRTPRLRLRVLGPRFWTEASAADAAITLRAGEVTAFIPAGG